MKDADSVSTQSRNGNLSDRQIAEPMLPIVDSIDAAISRLALRLAPVADERIPLRNSSGRILAESLYADRDSPPLDVSAMDGVAVRLDEILVQPIPLVGVSSAGSPPTSLIRGSAMSIFTGAPIPCGADTVIKREDIELAQHHDALHVSLKDGLTHRVGENIRRQAENVSSGSVLLDCGSLLTPQRLSVASTFGPFEIAVKARLRLAILNTGDELIEPGKPAKPWQIRDSNGPVLEAMLGGRSWLQVTGRQHIGDTRERIVAELTRRLDTNDTVILTGGVSMGAKDFVPDAIREVGGEIVFHRLPIRPGKPVLGAVGPRGQLILGLPGNPVSVAVTARRIGLPLLSTQVALKSGSCDSHKVTITDSDDRVLDLVWYRLVSFQSDGQVTFVDSRGSGDLVSLAMSDGFVEIPPGMSGRGPWTYRTW